MANFDTHTQNYTLMNNASITGTYKFFKPYYRWHCVSTLYNFNVNFYEHNENSGLLSRHIGILNKRERQLKQYI